MESRRDFGALAVELGFVTHVQLWAARVERNRLERRGVHVFLAEVLVLQGALTNDALAIVLARGRGYVEATEGREPEPRFGDVAVRKGYVDPFQLFESLQRQRDEVQAGRTRRRIGEIMLERGLLSPWELEDVLLALADLSSGGNRTGETPTEAHQVGADLFSSDVLYARRPRSAVAPQAPCFTAFEVLRAGDVMSQPVLAPRDLEVGLAVEACDLTGAMAILVVDGHAPAGVLSVWEARECDAKSAVGNLATTALSTVSDRAPLEECVRILNESNGPCLAVLSGGRVVGAVTASDLQRAGVPAASLDVDRVPDEELGGGD